MLRTQSGAMIFSSGMFRFAIITAPEPKTVLWQVHAADFGEVIRARQGNFVDFVSAPSVERLIQVELAVRTSEKCEEKIFRSCPVVVPGRYHKA